MLRHNGALYSYPEQAILQRMSTEAMSPSTEVALWLRILHPDGKLTPEVAHAILKLSFPPDDLNRMRELAAKAHAGTLAPEEDGLMDEYERVGALLSILKSKARQVIKRVERSA